LLARGLEVMLFEVGLKERKIAVAPPLDLLLIDVAHIEKALWVVAGKYDRGEGTNVPSPN